MNILMTIASLDQATGGPARSVPFLGRKLLDRGFNVQFFVAKNPPLHRSAVREMHSLKVEHVSELSQTLDELESLERGSTIIHNHGIWLPINHKAAVLAKKANIPLVNSPRGMLEPWALQYRNYKKMLAWWIYQRHDLSRTTIFHATAEQEARNIKDLGYNKPIAIIPNGVDIPHISLAESSRKKTKTVLFLSRIHPVKGLKNLIYAWHGVRPKNWRVVIAGPDENNHRSEIEKEVRRMGLEEEFSFVGPVEDRNKWLLYNEAELFVLPSFSENFSIVVAEALGSGTPVISTKATPWSELETKRCGWWIETGVEPLAQALKEATCLSQEERLNMGQRGRQLILEKYTWEKIAHEMSSMYEWVLHKKDTPDCVIQPYDRERN